MRPETLARIASCLALGWLACADDVASRMREHTYPPTFRYFTKAELTSTMLQLADLVSQIDRALRRPILDDPAAVEAGREEVDRLLGEMQRVSRTLGPGGWPSNHPVVGPNVEKFRLDLAAARRALRFDPPSYYLAGSIAGACLHCHGRQ
jgi:hypothetical protein